MATYIAFPNTTTGNSANQNASEPTTGTLGHVIPPLPGPFVAMPRTLTIGSAGGQVGYANED